jgi:serine/threonine-protein kinase
MAALPPGTLIDGRYAIESTLSEGGFGLVYVARDQRLDKKLAVKVLKAQFSKHESVRPRFTREAKVLAALNHPNIVTVTDFGIHEGGPYLVMELLSGCTLRSFLDRGLPSEVTVHDLMAGVLDGLAYAHAQGIVHRDLKPGNIFLEELPTGRRVKILDFGFAKALVPEFEASTGGKLTAAGVGFGSPSYVAPEQVTDGITDTRTDVYGAGIILFEMLAGVPPFQGDQIEVLRKQVHEAPPRLEQVRPDARPRPELQQLLVRALYKRPADRFANAGELADALRNVPRPWLPSTTAPAAVTERPPAGVARWPRRQLWIVAIVWGVALVATVIALALLHARAKRESRDEPSPRADGS